jgi:hypothetical protein
MFENRVLRKIFGPEREQVAQSGGDCIMKSFMNCSLASIIWLIMLRRVR